MHIGVLSKPNHFHTKKWIKALKQTGVEVSLFSMLAEEQEGVRTIYIPPRFMSKGKLSFASYLFTSDRLAKALAKHQIDILNPINITPFGVWGDGTRFRPIVNVSMGADIFEYPPKNANWNLPSNRTWSRKDSSDHENQLDKWKRLIFKYYVNRALQHSDLITGDNKLLIDCIHNWFKIPKNKLLLHRWGVEEELFNITESERRALQTKFQIQEGQIVIFSPRGMKPIYQGDIILNAFRRILQSGVANIKIIMLAAGYEIPEVLHKQAEELHGQFPHFHYVPGLVDRVEMCKLWNLVDIFISAPIYDGYSNALSEGRFIGAIPMVNDIPATRELLTHLENGWIVKPFTADKLAEDLCEVIQSKDSLKKAFKEKNKQWILANAHLSTNMNMFVKACERIFTSYHSI